MAVQRLTLAQITAQILNLYGVYQSADAWWSSDANLYKYINRAGQNIPIKVGMLLKSNKPVLIDFWRDTVTSATSGTSLYIAASASTGYLPTDYYHYESFYDLTNKRPVYVIDNPVRHIRTIELLKNKPAGPPEAIELNDMTLNSTTWCRQFTIYPSTISGVTPSISLVYYRLPATMAGSDASAEYPDAPVEFHSLWVYGPLLDLMAPNHANYERVKLLHDELIGALAAHAKVLN